MALVNKQSHERHHSSPQLTNNNQRWHYILAHLFATRSTAFKFKNISKTEKIASQCVPWMEWKFKPEAHSMNLNKNCCFWCSTYSKESHKFSWFSQWLKCLRHLELKMDQGCYLATFIINEPFLGWNLKKVSCYRSGTSSLI